MLINPRDEYMKNEGIKEGKQEGIEESKKEIAKELLKRNILIKEISKITKLTQQEIKKLD